MENISYRVYEHPTTAKVIPADDDISVDSWKAADLQKIVFKNQVDLTVDVDDDEEHEIDEYQENIKISGTVKEILQVIYDFYKDKDYQSHTFFEGLTKCGPHSYYLELGS